MKKGKSYLGRIKDSVDFIYALVTESDDGYIGGFESFGSSLIEDVSTALVRRGALIRNYFGKKGQPGRFTKYTWGSEMSPTNVLYKTIMGDLRNSKMKEKEREKERRKTPQGYDGIVPSVVIVGESAEIPQQADVVVPDGKKEYVTTLDGFSSQELWDELKKRGFSIEGDKLVIIKKSYLD